MCRLPLRGWSRSLHWSRLLALKWFWRVRFADGFRGKYLGVRVRIFIFLAVSFLLTSGQVALAQGVSVFAKKETERLVTAELQCMINYVNQYLATKETAGDLVDAAMSSCKNEFDAMSDFLRKEYIDLAAPKATRLDQEVMVDGMIEKGRAIQRSLILDAILKRRREGL